MGQVAADPVSKGRLAKQLGSRLRNLRQQTGYSQRQAADELDLTSAGVSKIESGHTMPRLAGLFRMAKLYGVTVSLIVDGLEWPDWRD